MTVKELFDQACALAYNQSNGMIPVSAMRGPGFFPGCIGIINAKNTREHFPTMVLGQDFDTEANHGKIDEKKGEIEKNTTWRNLKKLLQDLGINPDECFFTNAYMGLRPNNSDAKTKNTGTSPAAKKGAEVFAKECYEFFKVQLESIQPKQVLVLGKETAGFLCKAFPGSFPKWQSVQKIKEFYEGENLYTDLEFKGKVIRFVFVIHPSLNGTNRSILFKEAAKTKEQEMIKKYIQQYCPYQ